MSFVRRLANLKLQDSKRKIRFYKTEIKKSNSELTSKQKDFEDKFLYESYYQSHTSTR